MRTRTPHLPLIATALFACLSTLACQSAEPGQVSESTPAPEQAVAALSGTEAQDAASPRVETSAVATRIQDQELADDAATLQVKIQQRAVLSGRSIEQGDALLERADLEGALREYAYAISVDPTNAQARERFQKVEALLGDRVAVAADVLADEVDRELVRRAQARIAAERADTLGDAAMGEGDHEAAIARYREAQLILRYHPLIASDSIDERLVTGKLERAIESSGEAAATAQQRAEDLAQRARDTAERREREYRENMLVTLYGEANAAFMATRYARAEALCEQILVHDGKNEAASTLRDIARESRHMATERRNRRDYREQWLRTFEDIDTLNVIQNEAVLFDDLRRWREVQLRQPLEFSSYGGAEESEKAVVLERLEQTHLAPNFGGEDDEGAALEDVAAFLQSLTGVNFLISTRVREDLDEEETTIRLQLPDYSVRKILDIIAETSESLRWKVEDGVVKFVTSEEMVGGQVLRFYGVNDLIHPIPDFPGREINVQPSGGIFLEEEDLEERESNVVTADLLDELIRNNIEVDSWNDDPANSLQINEMGVMVVNQTPEVHAMIGQLLEDLREATGIMVDINARFLTVEDNFLEDIGFDFRGLGQPGMGTNEFLNDFGDTTTQGELGTEIGQGTDLGAFYDEGGDGDIRARVEALYDMALGDEDVLQASGGLSFQWAYLGDVQMELILRAVSKSERVELVSQPRILVTNTGRANLSVLNQVVYVKDFDVEIAQAASIAYPIIDVVQDGVILDVRPVVSADRRFITLELRPTIATLQRPIAEAVTTLGSQNSVTIQLPEVQIQRVRTSIPMPDGSTVLLGGLKTSDKKDQRSGVPILNKIPVLSAFFERKGTYSANRKLLILLNANIVIPVEIEPTPAQLGL